MKVALIAIVVILLGVFVFFLPKKGVVRETIDSPTSQAPAFTEYKAFFEIYTLGTKRIFTDKKYHERSSSVYITAQDPGTIFITKSGIAWADFFATLPMKLEKDCLTTGTGQLFCTEENRSLKFYINGIETPDALDHEILPNSILKVIYE